MKKMGAVLLAGALAAALALGGCGADETMSGLSVSAGEEDEIITADYMLSSTDYDVTKYVTLPDDYMNMTVELEENYEVTDADIQDYVETYILAYYPLYVQTDKTTVEDGDTVDIDYVGTMDGEEFSGGSAEGYELTIGSGIFIDGFEDGLIGHEVGETVDLDLTFPEDYGSEDLAGQDVVFTVTINGIMEETTITYDELTDEYVESNFGSYGMTTVDDLLDDVELTLEESNESAEESEVQELVLDKLVNESEIEFPDDLVDTRVDTYFDQIAEEAEEYGMDYEEYVTTYSEYDDVDEFEEASREMMEEYIAEELVLEAIVADQQISISRNDFDEFVDSYVAYYGYDSAEDFYEAYGGEVYTMLGYAENEALSEVIAQATVLPAGDDAEDEAEE